MFVVVVVVSRVVVVAIRRVGVALVGGELGRSVRELRQHARDDLLGVRLLHAGDHVDGRLRRHALHHDARAHLHGVLHPRRFGMTSDSVVASGRQSTLCLKSVHLLYFEGSDRGGWSPRPFPREKKLYRKEYNLSGYTVSE